MAAGMKTIRVPAPVEVLDATDGWKPLLTVTLRDVVARALTRPVFARSPWHGLKAIEILREVEAAEAEGRNVELSEEHHNLLVEAIDKTPQQLNDVGLRWHGLVLGQLDPLFSAIRDAA